MANGQALRLRLAIGPYQVPTPLPRSTDLPPISDGEGAGVEEPIRFA